MNKHMLLLVRWWMCRWCAYVLPPYLLQLFTFSITTFLGKSWPLLFAFTFDAKSRGATARRCQKCGDRQTDFCSLWLNGNILLQNVWPINGLEINFYFYFLQPWKMASTSFFDKFIFSCLHIAYVLVRCFCHVDRKYRGMHLHLLCIFKSNQRKVRK